MKITVVVTLAVVALCSCGSDEPDTILVAPTSTSTSTKLPRLNCYEIAQRVKRTGAPVEQIYEAQADCIQENARRGY